ncbi:MAG TPA: PspA/IM30 family protein [Mycobacteriales bacterium]|jgi:phage shock protein A|nr:PspA/IM30 family protein [Mycobacteriales bacterium]
MGMGRRLSLIVKAKANKLLDKHEDPRETLDYSYEKQLELLTKVKRGVADVATSRKRIELQMQQLQASADKLQAQAQQAVTQGRDDLAREALTRRATANQQLADLQTQHAQLQAEEEKMVQASQKLQIKVDAFRTQKETIKATYTAAEAQTKIGEAVSGISEEMGDVGMAMQRAQDKTQEMQARAGAVDELLASGALDDATIPGGQDDIQAELDSGSGNSDVELELAKLKGALPAGAAPAAIAGADATTAPAPEGK